MEAEEGAEHVDEQMLNVQGKLNHLNSFSSKVLIIIMPQTKMVGVTYLLQNFDFLLPI